MCFENQKSQKRKRQYTEGRKKESEAENRDGPTGVAA